MIHRIHRPPAKAVSRTAYLDYCLRSTGRSVKPVVLAGDPTIMRDLLQKSNFKESCTGGCLAFGEIIPDKQMLKEIISSYEDYCLAGLNPDDVQRIWILHEDKNKTELHFVFANLHLSSGKKYSHYAVQTGDWGAIDAWQYLVNEKYRLKNPLDEKYKRLDAQPINNLPKRKSEIKNKIDEIITAQIIAGRIRDRNDIVLFLEAGGFEVKQTRTGISIREIGSAEKFLRLKGGKYEHEWTGPTHKKPAGKGDRDDPDSGRRHYKVKSLEEYERIFKESTEKRAARQAKVHNTMCARTKLFSHVEPDSIIQGSSRAKTGTDYADKLTVGSRNPDTAGSTGADEKGESRAQETLESENSRIIPALNGGKTYGRGNHEHGGESGGENPKTGTTGNPRSRINELARQCETQSRALYDSRQRNSAAFANANAELQKLSDSVLASQELKKPKEQTVQSKSSFQVEPNKFTVREFRQTFRKKNGYCVVEFRDGLAWVVGWFPEMPATSDAQGKFLEGDGKLFKAVDGAWVELQKGKSKGVRKENV